MLQRDKRHDEFIQSCYLSLYRRKSVGKLGVIACLEALKPAKSVGLSATKDDQAVSQIVLMGMCVRSVPAANNRYAEGGTIHEAFLEGREQATVELLTGVYRKATCCHADADEDGCCE